jgi:pimeloyl-ACP methyl ester carboxylesterase
MVMRVPGSLLWVETGGAGRPTLLLLHGLGANAAVWTNMLSTIQSQWPGRWLAPDLRGHGRSPHAAPYGFAVHAADVAGLLEQDEEIVVLGHSMGGAVGMALASGWFGVTVRQVVVFGVKLVWSIEETAKARELGRTPTRWFATPEEAIKRYLRVSGLKGLIDPASPVALSGIAEEAGRFRLAADPRINSVVGPPIEDLIAAMRAPLRLAAGERDPMVTVEQMRRVDARAVIIPGTGHNPHVEAPEFVWSLVTEALS